jgi:hypothetical protein
METSLSFVLPAKCPVNQKNDCVCHEEGQGTPIQSQVSQDFAMPYQDTALPSDQTHEELVLDTPLNKKTDIARAATTSSLHAKRKITKAPEEYQTRREAKRL